MKFYFNVFLSLFLLSHSLYGASGEDHLGLSDAIRFTNSRTLMSVDARVRQERTSTYTLSSGPEWWEPQKQSTLNILQNRLPASFQMGACLPDVENLRTLPTAMYFKNLFNLNGQHIDVVIPSGRKGAMTAYLLKGFQQTYQPIFESLAQNFTSATYTKRDLRILKDHTQQALLIATYADYFIRKCFGLTDTAFSQTDFTRTLEDLSYLPAEEVNTIAPLIAAASQLNNNEIDGLGYLWYLNRSARIYFNNFYVMVRRHIKTAGYDLASVLEGPSETFDISRFEASLEKVFAETKEPSRKAKQKARKREKQRQKKAAEEAAAGSTLIVDTEEHPLQPTEERPSSLTAAAAAPLSAPPAEENDSQTDEEAQAVEVSTPAPHAAAVALAEEPIDPELITVQRDLQNVNRIVQNSHITGGMKSKEFLTALAAFNNLGYFTEFQANQKQVKVTLPSSPALPQGHNAIFHLNHSGRKKDSGITKRTAREAKKLVDDLTTTIKTSGQKKPRPPEDQ